MRPNRASKSFFIFSLILVGCGGGGNGGGNAPPAATYDVSVSVSGLTGDGLVVQNNGGDNLSVTENGARHFAAKLAAGSTYSVTITSQPGGQTCSVTNGSGTVGNADVTEISITCALDGLWISPASAVSAESTVWDGAWFTGFPSFAIDGSSVTKWTYNGMGSVTFDLGASKTIKGIKASWDGAVSNGNTVNVYVDGIKLLSNERFSATENIRYFASVAGRTVTYETVALPHNEAADIATWSEVAEFEVFVDGG